MSSKTLKEYLDTVARSQERLAQNKGVESVSVSNKINRREMKGSSWLGSLRYCTI